MDSEKTPDTATPSHQRPPFADPLAGGIDPTAPGAPHEPGGSDYRQSEDRDASDAPAGRTERDATGDEGKDRR